MRWTIATRVRLAASLVATASLGWTCVPVRAQSTNSSGSASSVTDAAKQATDKKKAAASAAKVITDDDLNPNNVKPGQEGLTAPTPQSDAVPPSPAEVAQVEAADAKASKSPADDPVKKNDSPRIKALKERLAQAEEALQLSQRESALEQDTVYSKPDYQHDTAGKAKLEELQQEISAHSQKVEELKTQLADLEKALEKETGNQPASTQPSSGQPGAPPQR